MVGAGYFSHTFGYLRSRSHAPPSERASGPRSDVGSLARLPPLTPLPSSPFKSSQCTGAPAPLTPPPSKQANEPSARSLARWPPSKRRMKKQRSGWEGCPGGRRSKKKVGVVGWRSGWEPTFLAFFPLCGNAVLRDVFFENVFTTHKFWGSLDIL